ncbi:hypothetical protein ACFLWS_08485 [Chloroflexota bacterium]
MDSMLDKIKDMEERRKHLQAGGGTEAVEKLHKATKLSVRERVLCFDFPFPRPIKVPFIRRIN